MVYKIRTGDKITITEVKAEKTSWRNKGKETEPGKGGSVEYVSQVEEVLSDTDIIALTPISDRQLVRLPEMSRYKAVFFTRSGMVAYTIKIDSYFQEGDVYLMKLRLVSKPQPMHNRKFYRLECRIPLKYSVLSEDNGLSGEEDAFNADDFKFDGMVRDISGGGMCFWSNHRVEPNSKIRCKMLLGDELLIVVGTVLNFKARPKKTETRASDYEHEYFVNFTGITNTDQEKLVKFIFAEQRALLKVIR